MRGSPKRKAQRGQYLLVVGLGRYKWYQSQTLGDVPARRLSPEGGGPKTVCQQGHWASNRDGLGSPTSIGKGNECQQRCWALEGGGL